MLKTALIPIFLLTVIPNIGLPTAQISNSVSPYNFTISSSIISPDSTDNILTDITITYTLKDKSSVLFKLTADGKTISIITEKPNQAPGDYTIVWDARDEKGGYIPDGLYAIEFYVNDNVIRTAPIEVRPLVAKINVPVNGALVRAQVPVFGIACGRNFKKYVVEYTKQDTPNEWVTVEESTIPKADNTKIGDISAGDETIRGNLATWDTGLTEYYYYDTDVDLSGPYLLRLTVFDDKGNKAVDEVNVDIGAIVSFIHGGTVESSDKKAKLTFEEHSIKTPFILFNIKEAPREYVNNLSRKEGYQPAGKIYEIEPEGVSFGRPASLTMRYDLDEVKNDARIAIYAYEPDLGIWEYLPSTPDKEKPAVTAKLKSTQNLYAYYAIFERNKNITAPLLYGLPEETQFDVIGISGEAEPGQKVKIYINAKEVDEAVSNRKTGIFKLNKALLDFGKNEITARAVDEFGDISSLSNTAATSLIIKNPKGIKSLKLKDSDFKKDLGGKKAVMSEELIGENTDKNSINAAPILIKSSLTEPHGIKILLPAGSCLCRDTFEEGFDEWKNLDGEEGAALTLDNEVTQDGNFCLKLENKKYGGSFGAIVRSMPYDTEKYPIISFDYKISPDVKINFLAKTGKRWYDIQFTDNPKTYERINMVKIGKVDNVICDNKWHHAEFNLYDMLKRYTGNKIIDEMIMADYDVTGFMKLGYGRNPEGALFYVDNFTISNGGSKTPPMKKSQASWEIGDNDNSNNEFLYEKEAGDDYYAGGHIEDFERAVTKSDPATNIHFYLSKEDSQKEYNFFIKAENWDVRNYDYVGFDVLLNNSKIAILKCPYKDGTIFNIKINSLLKEGENVLTLKWNGGGGWISWDYLKFEPLGDIKKSSANWEIGYNDNSFREFSHEMDISDDYTVGEDFKKFERAISVQDPIINIRFYLNKDMLDGDYELFIKPFDIQPVDSQPKISGAFFKILVNPVRCLSSNGVNKQDDGTYNITPLKEPLRVIISGNSLREGENIISLKWLAGCDWIMWDYLKFSPVKKR